MSFTLEPGEPLAGGLRRVAAERADRAAGRLESVVSDPDTAIHGARKDLKKIRAVVRLVRPALGDTVYRQENVAFRNAGRLLAPARESAAVLELLDRFGERFPGLEPSLAALRPELEEERRRRIAEAVAPDGPAVRARAAILAGRRRIEQWPPAGAPAMEAGLQRVYRQGRRRLEKLRVEPTAEGAHEWRKRAKDLWYHSRLLAPRATRFERLVRDLGRLTELLGDGNDLSDLMALLEDRVGTGSGESGASLLSACDDLRRTLWRRALRLGDRVYGPRPAAFSRDSIRPRRRREPSR